jgi:nucleotide-binding universal stress UspA family protein
LSEMKRVVEDNFDCKDVDCDFNISEGKILSQVIHFATVKNVDLIITGKKSDSVKSSILATQLANKAPCSVLIIPKDCNCEITNVFTAIDFSGHSHRALETALEIKELSAATLKCLHVYKVPIGYAKAVRDKVLNVKGSLLVLGSRGRGSVTSELILTAKTPVFAVKEKGENLNLLKALFDH